MTVEEELAHLREENAKLHQANKDLAQDLKDWMCAHKCATASLIDMSKHNNSLRAQLQEALSKVSGGAP
jgi:hypothetical protein